MKIVDKLIKLVTPAAGDNSTKPATTAYVDRGLNEIQTDLDNLITTEIGKIDLMPFRNNELPTGWYFTNGDGISLSSTAGTNLNSLSSGFKSDWGVTVSGSTIYLPNLFHSDGRGFYLRSKTSVGAIELDTYKSHNHTIAFSNSGNFYYSGGGGSSGVLTPLDTDTVTGTSGDIETRPLTKGMTPAIFLGV